MLSKEQKNKNIFSSLSRVRNLHLRFLRLSLSLSLSLLCVIFFISLLFTVPCCFFQNFFTSYSAVFSRSPAAHVIDAKMASRWSTSRARTILKRDFFDF